MRRWSGRRCSGASSSPMPRPRPTGRRAPARWEAAAREAPLPVRGAAPARHIHRPAVQRRPAEGDGLAVPCPRPAGSCRASMPRPRTRGVGARREARGSGRCIDRSGGHGGRARARVPIPLARCRTARVRGAHRTPLSKPLARQEIHERRPCPSGARAGARPRRRSCGGSSIATPQPGTQATRPWCAQCAPARPDRTWGIEAPGPGDGEPVGAGPA